MYLKSVRKSVLAGAAVAAGTIVSAGGAGAHPHVWVDSRSDILFNADGAISGIRHAWTFDEMFSAYAIQGLDEDNDGKLTREELQPLAQVNVESLNEFDYFTYLGVIGVDEVYGVFRDPVDYWLDYDGTKLTLHFTLPLTEPFDPKQGLTAIEVYDPTFFVDFQLAETDTALLVDAPSGCRLDIERAEGFDTATANLLSQFPADVRELPPEILELTEGNANTIKVVCE
ncbi:DUF1007 family protein [Microbaculum marinisediminis]|uniref:DUF1007 family protein n=1 Tax=Microbaculum marinisediminis TaxID=2931392 RepID=A0AAW5QZA0_9HYPH|nr:DUF1007 family protein [Microbaculum sp. A6E488]MCT8971600.1 DUF1007 family protein [Microbaculum sp. A6E488]